jgi:hypothetical protein
MYCSLKGMSSVEDQVVQLSASARWFPPAGHNPFVAP